MVAHRGFPAAEDLRDLAAFLVLELPEDEDEPLLLREHTRAVLEDAPHLALGEKRRSVGLRARPGPLHEAKTLGLRTLPRAARAQGVDREVAGDAKEPRGERPGRIVPFEIFPDPHERELSDVARIFRVAEKPSQERENARRPARNQLGEGVGIAPRGAARERAFQGAFFRRDAGGIARAEPRPCRLGRRLRGRGTGGRRDEMHRFGIFYVSGIVFVYQEGAPPPPPEV